MTYTPSSPPCPPPGLPRLAIPLGDPAGIGPEVVLKMLAHRPWGEATHLTVVGRPQDLARAQATLDLPSFAPEVAFMALEEAAPPLTGDLAGEILPGTGSALSGAVSFATLRQAVAHTLAGRFDAVVTAPIAKAAWAAAGHFYPGQTELLAEAAGVDQFAMAFVARSPLTGWQLRALLATTHIPLAQVPTALTPALLEQKLALLVACLRQDFGLACPTIAVAGLNPHSGEGGQLGRDEVDWLIPWLEQSRTRYPDVTLVGPVPPDTLWVAPGQAWFGTQPAARPADAYLALYHDQGLIPVKLMGFDRAVNTTLGLPFVRTSPDHGTAFDIAGQGRANATSMVAAVELAIDLVKQRRLTATS